MPPVDDVPEAFVSAGVRATPARYGGIPRPFLDWLAANGVDGRDVASWPLIEFDTPQPGMMRIEMIYRVPGTDYQGRPALVTAAIEGRTGALMRTVAMPVPMSEDLRAAWDHLAPRERGLRDMRDLIGLLGRGATVMPIGRSNRVVLVMRRPVPDADAERMLEKVQRLFPGICLSLLTGVSAVMVTDLDQEHHNDAAGPYTRTFATPGDGA